MVTLFKKPKTFEEGQKLRDKMVEGFTEDGTFIIAFRVGNDLITCMCGSGVELVSMFDILTKRLAERLK